MKKYSWLLKSTMLTAIIFTPICYADVESENAILARIVHELKALQPMINEAEKQQPKNVRLHFNYSLLRGDITKVEQGISQQLKQQTMEPQPVTPLKGDYLTVESLKP